MREILFRGKRIDNGEWAEGCLLIDYITGQYFIHRYGDSVNESDKVGEEGCLRFLAFEVDPSTICQYTGLTDKNGKKIWENDIVKVRHEKYPETPDTEFYLFPTAKVYERNYKVEFSNNGSHCGYRCRNRSIHFRITKNTIFNHEIKVIGNIFDNPELMEGE